MFSRILLPLGSCPDPFHGTRYNHGKLQGKHKSSLPSRHIKTTSRENGKEKARAQSTASAQTKCAPEKTEDTGNLSDDGYDIVESNPEHDYVWI